MDTPANDYDRHLGQWNRWMKSVYEESVPSEAILDRLGEFWSDLGEMRDQVSKIRPPRDARDIHELFLKMMVEEKRAIELLQGYYTTHNERLRSDANAALAQNGVLRREYDKELTDLWESCFGVPLGETKYPRPPRRTEPECATEGTAPRDRVSPVLPQLLEPAEAGSVWCQAGSSWSRRTPLELLDGP